LSAEARKGEGGDDGVPGAAKNTGDGAWLVAPKRSEGGLFEN